MAPAIDVVDLRKSFGKKTALDKVTFEVPEGQILGFIGPNGAGKTTTIRIILGLVRPDSGSVSILDHVVPRSLHEVQGRIGALLETSAFYPSVSAAANLSLLARTAGIRRDKTFLYELLERVGLQGEANKRTRTFSHGMRQRLALAAALLKDPDLLILDEPHTALDPSGVIVLRQLFLQLKEAGKTIFLSSHILSEIEKACDRLAFIHRGKIVLTASVKELTEDVGKVRVQIDDVASAARVLSGKGWTSERHGPDLMVDGASRDDVRDALVEAGLPLEGVTAEARETLDDVYRRLVLERQESEES